ncbi:MAG: bifunctional DNA primase/polymerase [Pseudonocardia sp.]|nr:bifunctional DNA primase/polymerase [Pseudonocardia sp.]
MTTPAPSGAVTLQPSEREGCAVRPNRFLDAALWLAGRGMHVFPLRPGTKTPAVRTDWEGCATTDLAQIRRWWGTARSNIGIATGRSGLLVVDLDVPKQDPGLPGGRAVLAAVAQTAGAVVPDNTMTVATPSGGQHLYFRAPPGVTLTNTVGRIGPHVDTRAVGGYVVAPGSMIGRKPYRLTCIDDPLPAPQWLLRAIRPQRLAGPPPDRTTTQPHPAYVRAAVDGEARRVAEATIGRRNHVLFTAAARLARFVDGGQLREADVHAALAAAAGRHVGTEGFTNTELRRTVQSGLRRATSSRTGATGHDGQQPDRPGA